MALISIFKKRENNEPAAHPLPHGVAAEPPALPPLLLLTSDAAGPSVRRLHTFPDAESAADHIQFWFPVSERSSVIAFWALAQEPGAPEASGELNGEAETASNAADSAPLPDVEVVVLIQHADHAGSVYPFSFADMDIANRFIRQEIKRGLDLRSVRIYWAAFATLEHLRDAGVTITPATPPAPAPDLAAEPIADSPGPPPPEPVVDPIAAYEPPTEPTTLNDVIRDLATALNVNHRPRETAFQGFGSPRGRF